jgi:branched-chain amino acid transport system substrate-binding protein
VGSSTCRSWVTGWARSIAVVMFATTMLVACAENQNNQAADANAVPVAPAPAPEPTVRVETRPPESLALTPAPVEPPTVIIDDRPAVAVLLPLSGRVAQVGQAMLDAAQLAIFDLAPDDFEIQVHDTAGTPQGAAEAARAAIEGGARLIVGPLFGDGAIAAKPIATAARVPMLSFSNTKSVAGDGVWVLGLLPGQQVDRVIGHAAANGHSRLGLMVPSTAYGDIMIEEARQSALLHGMTVTRTARYDPAAADQSEVVKYFADYDARKAALGAERRRLQSVGGDIARSALSRMKGLDTFGDPPFDAVLMPEAGAALRGIAPLLPYFDIDTARIRLLGTAAWDEPGLGREPALVGAWYASPSPDLRAEFEVRYQDTFGRRPPVLAVLAYDAMALAIVQTAAGPTPDFSEAALTAPSGFAGLGGIFRLLPDGSNQRGLAVMEIGPDGSAVVAPAPASFADFGS